MKHLLLLLSFALILFSCKKDEPEPEKPVITGTLKGKVTHYDQFGTPYNNSANTTVVIVGKGMSTVTDQNGYYFFEEMSSGTYTLTFKKQGCGDGILQDLRYKFTDTTNYNVSIADFPDFSISNAYVKDTTWFSGTLDGIYYNASAFPANSKARVVAIVGKSPNLTITDPASYVNFAQSSLISTLDYGRFLSYSFLAQSMKFKPDSIIYVKIYPVANTAAFYMDNQLNRPVYKAFGTPFPTTFTLTMPQP